MSVHQQERSAINGPGPPGSQGDEPKARGNRSRSANRRDQLASWYVSEIVPTRNYYRDDCQGCVANIETIVG
jgi:hypothetical protein